MYSIISKFAIFRGYARGLLYYLKYVKKYL